MDPEDLVRWVLMDLILKMLHDCAVMSTCHIIGENGAESIFKYLVSSGNLGVLEPNLLLSDEGATFTHPFIAVSSDFGQISCAVFNHVADANSDTH